MSQPRVRVRFAKSRAAWPVVAMIMLGAFRLAGAQGTSQMLIGDVVGKDGGVALGHAMVTVLGVERQTFTSDRGTFAFPSLDPGKYRLRVVHIGYTPVEVSVTVRADTAPPRLRIELARLSVQLYTVRVLAKGVCTVPGRPNPDVDPDFAAIVAQVRMNAEQYQLLSDSFPFRYKVEQAFYSMRGDSSQVDPRFETEQYRSDVHGWEYRAGDVVERTSDGHTLMHLPTLRDFASYDFLNNHCFRYAGLDTTRDGVMIRIGFDADVQIRTPDVSGSVLLDAKTYQIKRTELDLTRMPRDLPQVTAVHVTTIFGELSPSIDVIEQVHGITSLRHHGWGATIATTEDQRSYAFEWIGSNPAHPAVQP
ncbi:MAG: carboxypeptidase regulatory-like domain-containing protein [Gemmatimonadaceae bacterium]